MKCRIALICIFCLPIIATAQFEQKVSVSLSGGMFGTTGPKLWMPDWGSVEEDKEPLQIANYKPGLSGTLGIQYNLNRHFSFQADVGIMYSGDWFYDIYDGDSVNFTSTTFEDNEWQAYHDLDMLDPDDSGPDRAHIENNTGLGLHPGLGIEFSINDNIGFHFLAGYLSYFAQRGELLRA